MAKVTSKLQVTIPKAIADRYGIRPGDDLTWVPAEDAIRVIPPNGQTAQRNVAERLRLFDQATARQRRRQKRLRSLKEPRDRGWTREEVYARRRAG